MPSNLNNTYDANLNFLYKHLHVRGIALNDANLNKEKSSYNDFIFCLKKNVL